MPKASTSNCALWLLFALRGSRATGQLPAMLSKDWRSDSDPLVASMSSVPMGRTKSKMGFPSLSSSWCGCLFLHPVCLLLLTLGSISITSPEESMLLLSPLPPLSQEHLAVSHTAAWQSQSTPLSWSSRQL